MSAGRATIPRARTAPGGSDEETMSLINQVLRDLDARRAAHGVGTRLPNDVRPLPKAPSSNWPLGIALGVALLVILGTGFVMRDDVVDYFIRKTAVDAAAPPSVVEPPVVASPVPESVEPKPATAGVGADAPESSAPPADVDSSSLVAGMDVSLRMADFMDVPAEPAMSPNARPVPAEAPASTGSATRDKKAVGPHVAVPASQQTPNMPALRPAEAPVATVENRPEDKRSAPRGKGAESAPVIERSPASGSPHEQAEGEYRKAVLALNQGRVTEAADNLRAALRRDEFHAAARQLLVKLLLEAKYPDEAIQVLQQGIASQPAQVGWAMSLARLQVDRGEVDAAWRTLEHSLPAAGNSPDYLGFAANVLQRLGRHDEATGQYRKAAQLAPADGRWWLGLGWSLDAQGNAAEARDAFLRARQAGNLSPELLTLIDQKLR